MAALQGPLKGIKIVEFAGIGPGPFCGMLLADLGAEIVQIDRPGGVTAGYGFDYRHEVINRGRRSVVLNLKDPADREVALQLVAKADAVIEGNRPGVMERLGLGPDECMARNPKVVYGRMTGWGQTGPMANFAGHDIDYIALSGALHMIGEAGGKPVIPSNFVGDMGGGGMLLALGITSAIIEASRSGKGQVVDAAMIEGASAQLSGMYQLTAAGQLTEKRGTHGSDGGSHFYNTYETKDGKWIAVGCIEPQFYAAFLRDAELTDPEFANQNKPAHWDSLKAKTAARIKEKTRDEWEATFTSEACVAPILALSEVPNHPHMKARDVTFTDENGVLQQSPAPKFSRTPGAVSRAPVKPGTDTDEVLRDWGVTRAVEPAQ